MKYGFFLIASAFVLSCVPSSNVKAKKGGVDRVNDNNGIALDGYDVAAYFREGQKTAVKGSKKWSSDYQGHAYYFSTEENKKLFDKNPSAYAPIYGGWCAWAVSYGKIGVPVNYDEFLIRKDSSGKDRLFLFYPGTSKNWKKGNHQELLKKASAVWNK